MKKRMDIYYCNNCKQDTTEDRLISRLIFAGNTEEPPEYEYRCPHCESPNIDYVMSCYCRTCGDVEVSNEGEQCAECHTCEQEHRREAASDDLWVGNFKVPF